MHRKIKLLELYNTFSKNFVDIRKQQFIRPKLFLNLSTKYMIEIIMTYNMLILTYLT